MKEEQQDGEESLRLVSGAHLGETQGEVGVVVEIQGYLVESKGRNPVGPLQGGTGTES